MISLVNKCKTRDQNKMPQTVAIYQKCRYFKRKTVTFAKGLIKDNDRSDFKIQSRFENIFQVDKQLKGIGYKTKTKQWKITATPKK